MVTETKKQPMLTTIDNEFSPFDDFSNWFLRDTELGYNTCAYLDRVSYTSESLTTEENNAELERAMDEIIKNDFMHVYKKVYG